MCICTTSTCTCYCFICYHTSNTYIYVHLCIYRDIVIHELQTDYNYFISDFLPSCTKRLIDQIGSIYTPRWIYTHILLPLYMSIIYQSLLLHEVEVGKREICSQNDTIIALQNEVKRLVTTVNDTHYLTNDDHRHTQNTSSNAYNIAGVYNTTSYTPALSSSSSEIVREIVSMQPPLNQLQEGENKPKISRIIIRKQWLFPSILCSIFGLFFGILHVHTTTGTRNKS